MYAILHIILFQQHNEVHLWHIFKSFNFTPSLSKVLWIDILNQFSASQQIESCTKFSLEAHPFQSQKQCPGVRKVMWVGCQKCTLFFSQINHCFNFSKLFVVKDNVRFEINRLAYYAFRHEFQHPLFNSLGTYLEVSSNMFLVCSLDF